MSASYRSLLLWLSVSAITWVITGFSQGKPGHPKGDCWQSALSQAAMNECAASEFHSADADMTSVYKKLLAKHASDAEWTARIVRAQEAWAKYRDAEVDAVVPREGSALPMCVLTWKKQLTERRTRELREQIADHEGDVCWGR